MTPLVGILFASQVAAAAYADCGANKYHAVIAKTEALVIKQVEPEFVSETLRDSTNACVRVEFSITKSGRASKLEIVETSGERALDRAVIEALKKYEFKPPPSTSVREYMLVIKPKAKQ